MKILLGLAYGVFLPLSVPAASALDYRGTWLGTVSESVCWRTDLSKAEPGDYKLTNSN